jgi:hypothetical protein
VPEVVLAVLAAAVAPVVEVVLTGAPAAAGVLAAEGWVLTAWVKACSRLANKLMPWSLLLPEESLPPPPPCRSGPLVVPEIAARVVWLEAEIALFDIISSAWGFRWTYIGGRDRIFRPLVRVIGTKPALNQGWATTVLPPAGVSSKAGPSDA